MRNRCGVLSAVIVLAWPLVAPRSTEAARCPDLAACRDCFDRTITAQGCDASELQLARQDRNEVSRTRYQVCAAQVPGAPGRCKLTRDLLNKCRARRTIDSAQSWSLFRRQVRRECERGRRVVITANRAFRACRRDPSCPCAAPTTTSTTSSTTTSTTSTTTTTTSLAGATTTTTTTSPTTTTGLGGMTLQAEPSGSDCQRACIRRVNGSCPDRCVRSCRGDMEALPKCERACRNSVCTALRGLCTPTEDTDFDSNNPGRLDSEYFVCCKTSVDCEGDDAETLACTPTTTTTTLAPTTTTTLAGATTTTIFGVTTTTGASTTSTTL